MNQITYTTCPLCRRFTMNKEHHCWFCDHCGKLYALNEDLQRDQQRAGVPQTAKEMK